LRRGRDTNRNGTYPGGEAGSLYALLKANLKTGGLKRYEYHSVERLYKTALLVEKRERDTNRNSTYPGREAGRLHALLEANLETGRLERYEDRPVECLYYKTKLVEDRETCTYPGREIGSLHALLKANLETSGLQRYEDRPVERLVGLCLGGGGLEHGARDVDVVLAQLAHGAREGESLGLVQQSRNVRLKYMRDTHKK